VELVPAVACAVWERLVVSDLLTTLYLINTITIFSRSRHVNCNCLRGQYNNGTHDIGTSSGRRMSRWTVAGAIVIWIKLSLASNMSHWIVVRFFQRSIQLCAITD
jgi:hypothetical protein